MTYRPPRQPHRRLRPHVYVESRVAVGTCAVCRLPERNATHQTVTVWGVDAAQRQTGEAA